MNDPKKLHDERKTALATLDEKTIRAWASKWRVSMPRDTESFYRKIHASRTHSTVGLNIDDRLQSVKWLRAHCTEEEIKDLKAEMPDESGSFQLDFFGGK